MVVKRSFLTTVVLLVVFAGLLAFVLLRDRFAKDKPADPKQVSVLTFDKATLQSAVFVFDGKTVEMVHEGDVWKMKQPFEAEARPEKMEEMLSALSALVSADTPLSDPGDPAQYGLMTPAVTVTLRLPEGEKKLELGDRDYTGTSVYARVSGDDRVHVVGSTLLFTLKPDPDGLKKL